MERDGVFVILLPMHAPWHSGKRTHVPLGILTDFSQFGCMCSSSHFQVIVPCSFRELVFASGASKHL